MDRYLKFAMIVIGFMFANSKAFTLGFEFLRINASLLSVEGILAVSGVFLANAAAVQLLIAGKYSRNSLFFTGIFPIIGYIISFLLLTKTDQGMMAIIIYSLSVTVGVFLLFVTMKASENEESLIL